MRIGKVNIISVVEDSSTVVKVCNATGVLGEQITNRAYIGQAGFSHIPNGNDIGIMFQDRNTIVILASEGESRPYLDNELDTVMYSDADKYIKISNDGDITATNGSNTITLKANGDIELGASNLDKLVKEAVLSTLALHTHPVSGAPPVAIASTDPAMLTLTTDPGNKTLNTKAD